MGILAVFKKKEEPVVLDPSVSACEVQDLDFLSAIEAHIRWKMRLEAYVSGVGEEELDAMKIMHDQNCVLGKWIHGAGGAKHGDHPMFQRLKETHAHFHRCAGTVVRLTDEGKTGEAEDLLRRGDYCKYSNQVKAELARLSLEIDHPNP